MTRAPGSDRSPQVGPEDTVAHAGVPGMPPAYGSWARLVIESAATVVVLGLVGGCGGTGGERAEVELVEVEGARPDGAARRNEPGDAFVDLDVDVVAPLLVEVDGLTFAEAAPPGPIELDLLGVEAEAEVATFEVARAEEVVGRLTIVTDLTSEGDVVDRFFDDAVEFLADEPVTADDGSILVATNAVRPRWVALADEFVLHAHEEVDDLARWQWFHGGSLWILEGSAASEAAVASIIEAQHRVDPPDPYDTHLIAGDLGERLPDDPRYPYLEEPRDVVFGALDAGAIADCTAEYLGVLVGEGTVSSASSDGIAVALALVPPHCGDPTAWFDVFRAQPGSTLEAIGGIDVVTAGLDMAWAEDGIAFHVHLFDPANRERFRPFIDAFVAHQAALPAPS